MSNLLLGIVGAVAHGLESDETRENRLIEQFMYETLKIVGVALTALTLVSAFYLVVNGMLFSALFIGSFVVFTLDLMKVGSNGENIWGDYGEMLRRMSAASQRIHSDRQNDLYYTALTEGTMVFGPVLRCLPADLESF